MNKDFLAITNRIKKFTEERDWAQFHNAKDLALAISIEASELNECFLWKSADEGNVDKIKDELADILIYALLFADKYNFDLNEIISQKLDKNEKSILSIKRKATQRNTQTYSSRPRAIELRGIFYASAINLFK